MPRMPLVAGNWKMHNTVEETRHLVFALGGPLRMVEGVETVICPPFPSLLAAAALLKGTGIGLGAQNMHWEDKGAFTGEVSPLMIKEFCRYVILGHSERRACFCETDEIVNRKLLAAQKHELIPILCVGETLEEREKGETGAIVERQVRSALQGVRREFAAHLVIAYEPVWAIGTGRAARVEDAAEVIGNVIRPTLAEAFGEEVAQSVRVLYGGSVNASNAAAFLQHPEIDGALVGGASLKANEFIAIVQAAQKV
ncbi:MAG: triose-phosphate isomerase [Chloroflexi bacterium]|nr:triose-phosphate isomerase [Chloroflexota bacterium]